MRLGLIGFRRLGLDPAPPDLCRLGLDPALVFARPLRCVACWGKLGLDPAYENPEGKLGLDPAYAIVLHPESQRRGRRARHRRCHRLLGHRAAGVPFVAGNSAGGACRTAEHRGHPGRRPGLFRPRLLRRRDPHAEPGRPGGGRLAVHAVLQHGAVLAVAGRPPDGLLRPAGPPRHGARRAQRRQRQAAGLGQAAPGDAPAARLSVVSLGQVARRRHAAGQRLRPFLLPRGSRPLLPSARALRGRSQAAARRSREAGTTRRPPSPIMGSNIYASTRRSTPTSRSSCTSPSTRRTSRCRRCRRTSPGTRTATATAGKSSARRGGGGFRSSAWSAAVCRTSSGRSGRRTTSRRRSSSSVPARSTAPCPGTA